MVVHIKRDLYLVQCGKCFYCGKFMSAFPWHPTNIRGYTVDHLYPRSKPDENPLPKGNNSVLACVSCNQKKGNRLPTSKEVQKHAWLKALISVV